MDNSIHAFPGISIEQPNKAKLEALVVQVMIIQIFNYYPDCHYGNRKSYPDFHPCNDNHFIMMLIIIII